MSERRGDRTVRQNTGRYSVPKFQFKDKLLQQTLQSMKNSLDALQGDARQGLNKGKNPKRAVTFDDLIAMGLITHTDAQSAIRKNRDGQV